MSEWDSSTGFWPAFVSLFVAKVAEAKAQVASDEGDTLLSATLLALANQYKEFAELYSTKSSMLAARAARTIASDVSELLLLPNPEESRSQQRIHLSAYPSTSAVSRW